MKGEADLPASWWEASRSPMTSNRCDGVWSFCQFLDQVL